MRRTPSHWPAPCCMTRAGPGTPPRNSARRSARRSSTGAPSRANIRTCSLARPSANDDRKPALRLCREITASRRLLVGRDGVIPFTVEFIVRDVDRVHLVIGHLDAFRVQVGVDLAADLQAGVGGRGADELDDDLMADQWFATPVHCDEGEEAMLNPVPLAGAGRQVGHRYLQASLIGEALQFALP